MGIQNRVTNLRKGLEEKGLEAAVIFSVENRRYFSDFPGSSGALIITQSDAVLLTDFRYIDEAHTRAAEHYEVIQHAGGALTESVGEKLKQMNVAKVGVEDSLSIAMLDVLEKEAPQCSFSMIESMMMKIRMIKDESEIESIRQGISLCDKAFEHILTFIKPGMTEKEIGLELEYVMKKNGAEGIKENHVIASGERSSLPHGQATDRVVKNGEFVKMDIGAKVNGYYTDFTRTVVLGEPSEKQLEIYGIVSHALEVSLQNVGPGKVCSELDNIGRSIIKNEGYGENFGHSLGHSLGLNIHEKPAMRSTDDTVLQPGMVITVEPGIYISGWGGVRIEDLVVIREEGIENLTKATKELQILNN
ncbi:Xaa-Pro peptidase family protein [Bacillus shivajii]|uniref:M24 family metallopeptidase n=1 Tax=Bacillus shivajii TaxID=1983719 RepID=UPI001CFBA15D|nr:Xaa-Pro peptidase family protein [Bacillus shivajii]UCZ52897.1 Xaa-Pro peptidase family protein [Bacillus shivajii]